MFAPMATPEPTESPQPPRHQTPEEFRAAGHATVDWLADYLAGVADRPVTPGIAPGEGGSVGDSCRPRLFGNADLQRDHRHPGAMLHPVKRALDIGGVAIR